MANKNVKICTLSSVIREMQIKTTMRYHFIPTRMSGIKKSENNKCWKSYGEIRTLIHCWQECKMVQPLWKTVWNFFKGCNIQLPQVKGILLLGLNPKEFEVRVQTKTCTQMFIAALFIIAKRRKQPKCPSTDKWTNKMCYVTQWNSIQLYKGMKS